MDFTTNIKEFFSNNPDPKPDISYDIQPRKNGFIKGQSGNPKGRAKGSKNKTTTELRAFYKDFLDQNKDNLQLWLDKTAEKDPSRALDIILKFSAFIIPKHIEQDLNSNQPIQIILPPNLEKE